MDNSFPKNIRAKVHSFRFLRYRQKEFFFRTSFSPKLHELPPKFFHRVVPSHVPYLSDKGHRGRGPNLGARPPGVKFFILTVWQHFSTLAQIFSFIITEGDVVHKISKICKQRFFLTQNNWVQIFWGRGTPRSLFSQGDLSPIKLTHFRCLWTLI